MRARALLVALALLAGSKSAFAYCRTTTCGPGECTADPSCVYCLDGGKPLYWPRGCVSFSVQKDGSALRGISASQNEAIVTQALQAWLGADCGGLKPGIDVFTFGSVACDRQEYNQKDGNANIWMFRDDGWPYVGFGQTLALTTLTFNVETGEIFDADVEINSIENDLTTDDAVVKADMLSIVTHEAGHFLGLSHSCVQGATMWPDYEPGDVSLRSLEPDDVAGICEIYPPIPAGESPPACDPTPRHGYSSECGGVEDKGCCSTAPGAPRPHAAWAIALGVLGAGLLGARRRNRRASQQ